jgi:protein AaeX
VRFNEINLFGVYVAPVALVLAAGWIVFVALRRATDRSALLQSVWHPALFELAVYVIIISSITLVVGRWGR